MMKEEVVISVKGNQHDLGEDASTEVVAVAKYYLKNEKHYFLYDEPVPEEGLNITNTVKIGDKSVHVIRRGGGLNVHMIFDEGKSSSAVYTTGAGDLLMDIFTERIQTVETESGIQTLVHYSFSMNGEFISKCTVEISARNNHT